MRSTRQSSQPTAPLFHEAATSCTTTAPTTPHTLNHGRTTLCLFAVTQVLPAQLVLAALRVFAALRVLAGYLVATAAVPETAVGARIPAAAAAAVLVLTAVTPAHTAIMASLLLPQARVVEMVVLVALLP